MTRFVTYLLLFALLGYGLWPYYTVFRLDNALAQSDPAAIAPYVDLPAIRVGYKARLDGTVDTFVPSDNSDGARVVQWLADNLQRLGDTALDQAITLEWVRNMLRDAVARTGDGQARRFIGGIDFAFFESWDRFVIRLGELGEGPVFVVMTLQGADWRVTDVVR